MTLTQAVDLVGDRATWELENMKKALQMLGALNTDEENQRLEAVKIILKDRRKK